ncbi:MAG: peptidase M15A [Mesorhizobium amorphae]|nr:MAG: peptidase M15A [Mesorhizobium amorphae]
MAPLLSLLLASCTSTATPDLVAPTAGLSATQNIEPVALAEAEADTNEAEKAAAREMPEKAEATAAEAKPEPKPEEAVAVAAAEAPVAQPAEAPAPVATAAAGDRGPANLVDGNKRAFLSSFFGNGDATPPAVAAKKPLLESPQAANLQAPGSGLVDGAEKPAAKPVIQLAAAEKPLVASAKTDWEWGNGNPLPGVRQNALFEIKRKSGLDDDSDIDLHEDGEDSFRIASAAGMARLAPNGLLKQRETVDTACLKPALVQTLRKAEAHFGKKVIITSGYRSPSYNRKVNGARKSMHMACAAADIQMPGVGKWELARYFRGQPNRGGVGTYCHESIHVDVGPERDWNWKCGRRRG